MLEVWRQHYWLVWGFLGHLCVVLDPPYPSVPGGLFTQEALISAFLNGLFDFVFCHKSLSLELGCRGICPVTTTRLLTPWGQSYINVIIGAAHLLNFLIPIVALIIALWGENYYHLYFADEENEAVRLYNSVKDVHLAYELCDEFFSVPFISNTCFRLVGGLREGLWRTQMLWFPHFGLPHSLHAGV